MPRNELFVGGVAAAAQARALREGVDIVVGTPGRVMDFIEQGKLPVDAIQFFVLDEAGGCRRGAGWLAGWRGPEWSQEAPLLLLSSRGVWLIRHQQSITASLPLLLGCLCS